MHSAIGASCSSRLCRVRDTAAIGYLPRYTPVCGGLQHYRVHGWAIAIPVNRSAAMPAGNVLLKRLDTCGNHRRPRRTAVGWQVGMNYLKIRKSNKIRGILSDRRQSIIEKAQQLSDRRSTMHQIG
jgi:hypothetical protein